MKKVAALLMGAVVLGSIGTALAATATPAAGGNAERGGTGNGQKHLG
jgi:hypothetical protein